jgi:hypothetical protein
MHVQLVTVAVTQDEVPLATIVTLYVCVAHDGESLTKSRDIICIHEDVEVAVRSCLFAEQRVHAPSSVHPDLDRCVFEKLEEGECVGGRHF